MISILLYILFVGLIDSLNPFSIGLQIVLLSQTNKKYDTIYYILGTFVTYFIGGILIFFGVDYFISNYLDYIFTTQNPIIYVVESILTFLLIFFVVKTLLNKQIQNEKEIKSVKPIILFSLGAVGTIFDIPTSIPYIAFLSKMITMDYSIAKVIPYLLIYNFVYLFPMIAIQIVYLFYREKIIEKLKRIKIVINKINKWIILFFCLVLITIFMIDIISFLIGKPILWK